MRLRFGYWPTGAATSIKPPFSGNVHKKVIIKMNKILFCLIGLLLSLAANGQSTNYWTNWNRATSVSQYDYVAGIHNLGLSSAQDYLWSLSLFLGQGQPGNGSGLTNIHTLMGPFWVLPPPALYGVSGKTIGINTNRGPAIDDWLGFMRIMGDTNGLAFYTYDGGFYGAGFDTLGVFSTVPRSGGIGFETADNWGNGEYSLQETAPPYYGAQKGAGCSMFSTMYGGSGAALSGLPPHGPEIWKNCPSPLSYFEILWDFGDYNNSTMADLFSFITLSDNSGLTAALQRHGVTPVLHYDVCWQAPWRNLDGTLAWNTNNVPLTVVGTPGMNYVSQICHDHGMQLHLSQYYWAVPTNGDVVCELNGQHVMPANKSLGNAGAVTTPNTIAKDVATLYSWGVDGVRVSDIAGQTGAGHMQQTCRQWADAILYPDGNPQNQNELTLTKGPMFIEQIFGSPRPLYFADSVPFECNAIVFDQMLPISPMGNDLLTITNAMILTRYAWTNFAWTSGKGHWNCPFNLFDPEHYGTHLTQPCWQFALSAMALWHGNIQITTNWFSGTHTYHLSDYTNDSFMSIYWDKAGRPAWRASDNGSNSVWVKSISGGKYAALLVNEGNSTTNITLDWSMLNPTNTWMPIEKVPEFTAGSNYTFSVSDVWGGTNIGPRSSSYTVGLASGAFDFVLLSPVPTAFFTGTLTVITNGTDTATLHFTNGLLNSITAP